MQNFRDEEELLATGGGDFEYTPPEIDDEKKKMRKDVYEYLASAMKQQTSRPSDIAFYAFTGENLPAPQRTPNIITPMDVEAKEAEIQDRKAIAMMREAQAKKYVADSMKKQQDLRKLEPTDFSVAIPGDSQARSATVYIDPYTGETKVVPLPEGSVKEKTLDRNMEWNLALERLRQGQRPEPMRQGQMSEKDKIELEAKIRKEQLEREAQLRLELEREKAKIRPQAQAKPSIGIQKFDADFATKILPSWTSGGKARLDKNLEVLEQAANELEKNPGQYSGTWQGIASSLGESKPLMSNKAKSMMQNIQETGLDSVKTFGANPTEGERKALYDTLYDPSLPEEENARKIRRQIKELKARAIETQSKVDYFNKNKTLDGWSSPMGGQVGKVIVRKQVNKKTGQTKYTYSDGTTEIK